MISHFVPSDRLSTFPPVRYIPEWLPWFSFKSLLRTGRALGNEMLYPPIEFVKESMVGSIFIRIRGICKFTTKRVAA